METQIAKLTLTPFGVNSIRKAEQEIEKKKLKIANLNDVFNDLSFLKQFKGTQIIINSDIKVKTRTGKIIEPNEMIDGWYAYADNYFTEAANDLISNEFNPRIHFGATAILSIINNDLIIINVNYDLKYELRIIAHAEVLNGTKAHLLLRQ
ncbi:MAG: hypothetical protein M1538_01100 [Candidatus Marsarchaeota archaeon]|jgi:hypothetical protein|nr:hypothetical protein [Candidatus Marsarchaeota archaeon]